MSPGIALTVPINECCENRNLKSFCWKIRNYGWHSQPKSALMQEQSEICKASYKHGLVLNFSVAFCS